MSAAEKLRELDKAMPHAPTHIATWPLFWEYLEALPQIVAVIDAAERLGLSEFESNAWYDVYEELPVALAALDEALTVT